MKHIKTVNKPSMQASLKTGGCGECQASCQSACKTSCGRQPGLREIMFREEPSHLGRLFSIKE